MVVSLNNSTFQFSKVHVHAQLQGCWHGKKLEPLCMAIINSNEKKIIYNFGNDFYFQNEELGL